MKRKLFLCLTAVLLLATAALLASCHGDDAKETESEGEESTSETASESLSETENETESDSETETAADPVTLTLNFEFDSEICAAEDGSIIRKNGFASTDYLEVKGFYAFSYLLGASKEGYSVSFYDADKTFISGVGQGEGNDERIYLTTRGSVVVPEGAVYVRFANTTDQNQPLTEAEAIGYPNKAAYEVYRAEHPLDGLKITCIGDSLTEGDYGLAPGVANVHYRNYPFYFSMQTGATVANYGCCGATATSYFKDWMPKVDVSDADVIVIMLGSNLGLQGTYGASYKKIVKKVQHDMKEGATIILVTPPHATENPDQSNYGYNPDVIGAVKVIRNYAAETGLAIIDAYTNSPIQAENEDLYQPNDGLHMAEDGYKAFAEFMAEEIRKILGIE